MPFSADFHPKSLKQSSTLSLPSLAKNRLTLLRSGRVEAQPSLRQLIDSITPKQPHLPHLNPLLDLLERTRHEPVNAVVHAPPRHGKTDTILKALAWLLKCEPSRTNAFASYSDGIANEKSGIAREYAEMAGVRLNPSTQAKNYWRTTDGGGLKAAGIEGALTGFGADGIIVVDDPYKTRAEAESAANRKRIWEWFTSVAFTRRQKGASVIVVMTRWHPEDLAGTLIDEKKWEYLKLPAIDDNGKPLWPEAFDLKALREIETLVGAYDWESLYQGNPVGRGGAVFNDVTLYEPSQLPFGGRRGAGVDFAYSQNTRSDYSVIVQGLLHQENRVPVLYLTNVFRSQVQAPQFKPELKRVKRMYPGMPLYAKIAGPERGVVDLLDQEPDAVKITVEAAVGTKFTRSLPVAAAWNAGRVRLPKDAPWLDTFLSEVMAFTGMGDKTDDQVDGLINLWDGLLSGSSDIDRLLALGTM